MIQPRFLTKYEVFMVISSVNESLSNCETLLKKKSTSWDVYGDYAEK